MNVDQFERELRQLLRAEPFRPFTIVLSGDRTIFVDEPAIAFGGGAAGFIDAEDDVHFFNCKDVHEFRMTTEEMAK